VKVQELVTAMAQHTVTASWLWPMRPLYVLHQLQVPAQVGKEYGE
jgi:hypothetical protein